MLHPPRVDGGAGAPRAGPMELHHVRCAGEARPADGERPFSRTSSALAEQRWRRAARRVLSALAAVPSATAGTAAAATAATERMRRRSECGECSEGGAPRQGYARPGPCASRCVLRGRQQPIRQPRAICHGCCDCQRRKRASEQRNGAAAVRRARACKPAAAPRRPSDTDPWPQWRATSSRPAAV